MFVYGVWFVCYRLWFVVLFLLFCLVDLRVCVRGLFVWWVCLPVSLVSCLFADLFGFGS